MLGFKSFGNAAITLTGIELAHRIRKRQYSFGPGRQWRNRSLKQPTITPLEFSLALSKNAPWTHETLHGFWAAGEGAHARNGCLPPSQAHCLTRRSGSG